MSKFAGLGLATEAASRMTIMHPVTGQPLRRKEADEKGKLVEKEEAFLDLLSRDSKAARQHDRLVADKQLRSRGRRLTAEELEGDRLERLAKLTRGWRLVTLDGAPLEVPFSEATARELYAEPTMAWLRDQAQTWVDDLGNYAAEPSKGSSTSPVTSEASPSP